MNKFVTTALGLAAVSSIGSADPGDGDWLGLDSEINSISPSLNAFAGASGWSVLLRSTFAASSDELAGAPGAKEELSGFGFNDIDVAFFGGVGDFTYRVSADLDGVGGNSLELEDAYANWPCGDMTARFGQFKPDTLRSATIDPEHQLFPDRTLLGSAFDMWDQGVSISGINNDVRWGFALMNGQNEHTSNVNGNRTEDHRYILSFGYDIGNGAGDYEGARGGNRALNASAGLAVINDNTESETLQHVLVQFNGNYGQWGFGLDVVDFDGDEMVDTWAPAADFGQFNPIGSAGGRDILEGGTTPYAVTVSYLARPDVEVGFRHENTDNNNDLMLNSLGVSYYRSGSNAQWKAAFTEFDGDNGFANGNYFQVGLTVGMSR